MLEVKNVDIRVSTRYLIKNLSFTLDSYDKLAIIGEEGNGKSTLLKALLGICDYAEMSGSVNVPNKQSIGYLPQSLNEEDLDKSVYCYLFSSNEEYYNSVNTLYRLLDIIKVDDSLLDQTMNNLSGGEKVKIGILKLLLKDDDILFLDEPTNDLDIETLEWLENFIKSTEKPVLFVSHDETLLSKCANMILHIEQIKKKTEPLHTIKKTDYETYVKERLKHLDDTTRIAYNERRELKKKQEKLNRIMNSVHEKQKNISRSDPHGAKVLKVKMKSLKTQENKLENTDLTEVPDPEESIYFKFEDVYIPKSKEIIKLDIHELKVDDKVLSKNINLDIIGNVHMCIIGKNGVGKSTLIKIIYDKLKNRNDLNVGYMPQVYSSVLNEDDRVIDFIASTDINDITEARKYLGNMNFTRDEMNGRIKDLSNGTIAKLFLVSLVRRKCNVLILDEPTRNVSPLSNPVIRSVLKNFEGTIISVSHDRKYLDEVIDELYLLDNAGLTKIDKR